MNIHQLTDRQRRIVQVLLTGKSWTETAQIVGCHKATVEYTLKSLRQRLGFRDNQRLLDYLRCVNLKPGRVVSERGIRQLPSGNWEDTFVVIGNRGEVEDSLDGDVIEITQTDIDRCIAEFTRGYTEILAEIRKHATSVAIKFGAISYWI